TAFSGVKRPRMAGTLRCATAGSAMTMLVPVCRAMTMADAATLPAGALIGTPPAYAGALTAIAAIPIQPECRILPNPDLPGSGIVPHVYAKQRTKSARIGTGRLYQQAA